MRDDDLDEVAENIAVLIQAELETQHRLGGHPTPLDECPVCRAHAVSVGRRPQWPPRR